MSHYVRKNEWKTAVPPPPPPVGSPRNMLRRTPGRHQALPISRIIQNDVDSLIRTIDKIPKKIDKEASSIISESKKRYRIGDGKLKPYGEFMAAFPKKSDIYEHYKYKKALMEAGEGVDYAEYQLDVIKQHIDLARQNLKLIEKTMTDVVISGQADYTLRDRAQFEVEQQMKKEGVTLDDLDSPTRQLMTVDGGKSKTRRRRRNRTIRKMY
jgi:hypothetical protein